MSETSDEHALIPDASTYMDGGAALRSKSGLLLAVLHLSTFARTIDPFLQAVDELN